MSELRPELEAHLGSQDLVILDQIEEELSRAALNTGGYTSPAMSRISGQRLTVEMLAEEIPILRAAEEAAEVLAKNKRPKGGVALRKTVADGELAKERLFSAALPLIRAVASREWRRRQQWGSQVPLEDLTQDAIVGFFKGLSGFRPEAVRRSATNYLGQWMLVEMRRSAESLDHDLQVGHDAGERFRRVRALRSRLINELGREPTDEEISNASRDPAYLTRPGMMGRAPAEGEAPAVGRGLTVAQVAEERSARQRVGHSARFASSEGDEPMPRGVIDTERLSTSDWEGEALAADPADLTGEADAAAIVAAMVGEVLDRMRLPDEQREVISRRFGLAPYPSEASAREISRAMGVHRERVTRILNAFSAEMTKKGGLFHEVVGRANEDDLLALGLAWITTTLGPWDPKLRAGAAPVQQVLLEPMIATIPAQQRDLGTTKTKGMLAHFQCDYHDRIFSGMYPDKKSVPKVRPCPSCQQASYLLRVTETP